MQSDVKNALQVLLNGGLILYPTDTVWGIGCDATNPEAVEKIYKLKKRSDSKSMLVLLDSEFRLPQYVTEVPEMAYQLIEVTDKPLTIIYPGSKNIAPNLSAEDGSIGIRITTDPFCKQLISRLKKPIVSTSANVSGENPPAIYEDIQEFVRLGVDYIVEHRQDDNNPASPSSIIKLGTGGEIQIIRP
jgi:L-threonylcarbamoyladenylate synthase